MNAILDTKAKSGDLLFGQPIENASKADLIAAIRYQQQRIDDLLGRHCEMSAVLNGPVAGRACFVKGDPA